MMTAGTRGLSRASDLGEFGNPHLEELVSGGMDADWHFWPKLCTKWEKP
jgi:hypothetical protein